MYKINEVIQEEISDCGICCLKCIINYYGGNISLESLRFKTNTDDTGTNAYELISASLKLGFNALGKKVDKINTKDLPVIAHLKLDNNFYHFVVIYKIKNNQIYMMDPSVGKRKITLNDFYKIFTGVILIFKPINSLITYKDTKYLEKNIIEYLKKHKIVLLILITLSLFSLFITILLNLEVEFISIKYFIIIFSFLILINEVLLIIKNNLIIDYTNKINKNIIISFVKHLFNLPLKYLKLKKNGEIVSRFNELNNLTNNIISICIDIIFTSLLISVLFIILSKKKKLSLFIIIVLSVFFIANIKIYKKLINKIRYSINLEETYNSSIIDYISNIETIKNINVYDYFIKNINKNIINRNKINKELYKKIYKINSLNNIFLNIFLLIILYYLLKNNFNITNCLTIYIIVNYLISNIKKLIDYYPSILLYKSFILKNNDFLSISVLPPSKNIHNFNIINLNNIRYRINNNIILNNLNFKIKCSEKILIKGPSGIGKSTMLKIINKEIDNYDGNILVDNINLKDINVSNLITYTSQNEQLFNDTILNNITLNKKYDKDILNNIIKICRINEIKIVNEIGLDSNIINNSNLSGGERNRIVLARSLFHSKNIIILDEVLKEVDYDLEVNIIKDLLDYYKDKTIIYVTHKNVDYLFPKVFSF